MTSPPPDSAWDQTIDPGSAFGSWCDAARSWPLPGGGSTARRFDLLSAVARSDVVMGRLVEAHADAVAILAELGGPEVQPGQRWGVWAAGPAMSVTGTSQGGSGRITGTKRWCSGAGMVTHALVDVATPANQTLFAVELSDPGVTLGTPTWVGAGMARSDTRTVHFSRARATVVGAPGAYLTRPGFWAGAVGVAACWYGGAQRVGDKLIEATGVDRDPHLMVHLGAVHAALTSSAAVLQMAAADIDRNPPSDHYVTAATARSVVERDSVEVIERVGRALGPGPLAHDARHSSAVADLTIYLRQHHGEWDLAELGRRVAAGDAGR